MPRTGNADECRSFFTDVLQMFRERGITRGTIVLDNVRFHHSATVAQLFPEDGPFQLHFLPPYTPDFNPIENMFSKWKNEVCNLRYRNKEELQHAIATAAGAITDEDIHGYYQGVTETCVEYYRHHPQQ